MVIISTAICTKAGKIICSRQYTNVSKLQLEEYVRNFPKSISDNSQHTYVDSDSIRYIYLPLETMYLLLITNKNSNIIEDLETIRLVHRTVNDICSQGVSESMVQKNAFDILLAFDDVISFGYRESVTLNQIQNALAMDSSDEKLHLMLLKARVNEAKEAAKKAQLEIQKKQKDPNYKPSNAFSGGGSGDNDSGYTSKTSGVQQEVVIEQPKFQKDTPSGPVSHAPKKGMSILKKKEQKSAPQIAKKEEIKEMLQEPEAKPAYNPLQAPLLVEQEEKIVCTLQKDGDLSGFEVKGDVFLTVRDPSKGNCAVFIEPEQSKAIQLKPNPHLNKQFWLEKQAVAPKDLQKAFQTGSKINCLKYRFASTNLSDVPFTFTYWFNEGSIQCELEFNEGQSRFKELNNVGVYFNFPSNETPDVKSIENGDYEVSSGLFTWTTTTLNSQNSSSNIEVGFSSKIGPDDLFPFSLDFKLDYTFYTLGVKGACTLSDSNQLNCDFVKVLGTERFEIQ